MIVDDLDTPALLVEKERLERNLRRMQERADAGDARLRPHIKTHKSPPIAQWQQQEGGDGIAVATPGEAEAFFEEGFEDIRVAYTVVGDRKHARLARLMNRGAEVSFCADTEAGIAAAAQFYDGKQRPARVLLEIDVGHGRCGVPWQRRDRAEARARQIAEAPALQLAGLLTHAGQGYQGPREGETPDEALRRVAREERERILGVAAHLGDAGLADPSGEDDPFEISIGSTPSMTHFPVEDEKAAHEDFSVTEVRPGNYVFYDAMQVALGSAALEDCALTALATVTSKRRSGEGTERLYLDAGKKVLTTDRGAAGPGYGTLLYNAAAMRPWPHAQVHRLSEEHAWLEVPGGAPFTTGDRVRVVPNHACVTVATQDVLHLVDGEDVIQTLPVVARGHAG
ncbi:MAG: metal-activated pyridoxal enzyme [Bacteroidetes bacterium QS_9_68_14]|nr:MAG: metal-activated pyridoxal enzyme [Bacteroidetes bacterium QS_9_68_14]